MAKRISIRNTATVTRGGDGPESVFFPGEVFGFEDRQVQTQVSDEELNTRYAKGDIRIVSESARYPLAGILSMLQEEVETDSRPDSVKEKRYKLDPEYQRRHRWNNQRKSRLIESFLMNIPVPPVFLYERDLARFEVMDGRQRLTALAEYYADEFRLEGLQYWPELNGRTYTQLPSQPACGHNERPAAQARADTYIVAELRARLQPRCRSEDEPQRVEARAASRSASSAASGVAGNSRRARSHTSRAVMTRCNTGAAGTRGGTSQSSHSASPAGRRATPRHHPLPCRQAAGIPTASAERGSIARTRFGQSRRSSRGPAMA
jgi:hypothetical protein